MEDQEGLYKGTLFQAIDRLLKNESAKASGARSPAPMNDSGVVSMAIRSVWTACLPSPIRKVPRRLAQGVRGFFKS